MNEYKLKIRARKNKDVTPDLMDVIIHTLPPRYRNIGRKDLVGLVSGEEVEVELPNEGVAEKFLVDVVKEAGHKLDIEPIYKNNGSK